MPSENLHFKNAKWLRQTETQCGKRPNKATNHSGNINSIHRWWYGAAA